MIIALCRRAKYCLFYTPTTVQNIICQSTTRNPKVHKFNNLLIFPPNTQLPDEFRKRFAYDVYNMLKKVTFKKGKHSNAIARKIVEKRPLVKSSQAAGVKVYCYPLSITYTNIVNILILSLEAINRRSYTDLPLF